MTKKQYLSKLRSCLQFKFAEDEINDIIADMEECFDSGAAEGRTEEAICLELGEPKAAARELFSERNKDPKAFRSRLAEYWLPLLICAAVGIIVYYAEAADRSVISPFVYLIPPLMWLITERKNFFSSMKKCRTDFFMPVGAVLLLCSAALFGRFPQLSMTRNENTPVFAVLSCLMICAAMVMLIISIYKTALKPLIVLPLGCIAEDVFFCFSIVNSYETYGRTGGYDRVYSAYIGGYFGSMLYLIMVCSVLYWIWTVFRKSAFSLPSAYLAMMSLWLTLYIYDYYSKMDPLAQIEYYASKINNYIYGGAAAFAASMLLVIAVRLFYGRRKKGDA